MAQLSRWLLVEGLGPADLTPPRIEQFLAARRASGCRQPLGKRLCPLLGYLRDQQVLPPPAKATSTLVDELLDLYGRYLVEKRDLGPSTVPAYESLARRFLQKCLSSAASVTDLQGLTGGDVAAFLLEEVARLNGGSPAKRVTQLRSLLRFLRLNGLIASDLAATVPPAASWREARLPSTVTPSQITALLATSTRMASCQLFRRPQGTEPLAAHGSV